MGAETESRGNEIVLCQNVEKGYDIPFYVEACLEHEQDTRDVAPLISVEDSAWLGDAVPPVDVGGVAGGVAVGAAEEGSCGAVVGADEDDPCGLVRAGLARGGDVKIGQEIKKQKKSRGSIVKKSRKKKSLLPSYFKKKRTRKQNGEAESSMHQELLACEGNLVSGDINSCDKERELEIVLECGNPVEDARRLWEMGKELGVLSVVGDEPVIRKLTLLEMNALGIVVEGEYGVSGEVDFDCVVGNSGDLK
ncbi:hypothetical protein RIF29_11634 [Crotalaria pallida]|uniref:Uncharacterized protein n=1 Tax=Crotalaria pallida TaxID=3830 RepID=A0AAN9IMA6_CROPI